MVVNERLFENWYTWVTCRLRIPLGCACAHTPWHVLRRDALACGPRTHVYATVKKVYALYYSVVGGNQRSISRLPHQHRALPRPRRQGRRITCRRRLRHRRAAPPLPLPASNPAVE